MKKPSERDKDFMQGYAAALVVLSAEADGREMVRRVVKGGGFTIKSFNGHEVEAYDLRVIRSMHKPAEEGR